MNQVISYHRAHKNRGLAGDVDYRRSVAEPPMGTAVCFGRDNPPRDLEITGAANNESSVRVS